MDFTISLKHDFPNDQWLATVRCQRFPVFNGGTLVYERIRQNMIEKTEAKARAWAEQRVRELTTLAEAENEKAGIPAQMGFCEEDE